MRVLETACSTFATRRDYWFAYLVPTEVFLREAIDLVYRQTHDLAGRVFDALFPPAADDD